MNNDFKSSVNVKQAVPLFMVVDMPKSLEFYINGLGFQLKNKWEPEGTIEWCWLQFDDASLMLQEYRNKPSTERFGFGVSIYFICEDALKIYDIVSLRGLAPAEPFVGNNMWVVQFSDPDGYNIIFESATEVAEETTYYDWTNTNKPN